MTVSVLHATWGLLVTLSLYYRESYNNESTFTMSNYGALYGIMHRFKPFSSCSM